MRLPPQLDDDNAHERWLVSYADFMTLLFALFVVMYAATRASDSQIEEVVATLRDTFNITPSPLDTAAATQAPLSGLHTETVEGAVAASEALTAPASDLALEAALDDLQAQLSGLEDAPVSDVVVNPDWIEISLSSQAMFESGSTTLTADAVRLMEEIGAFLAEFDNPVIVEGYTDNVPIESARFPSNWELSAFRASVLTRFLQNTGVSGERLTAVGYGENHPLETNATPGGRQANRRVNIVVARRTEVSGGRTAYDSHFVQVRRAQPPALDEDVVEIRKPDGGLLFTAPGGNAEDAVP